MLMFCFLVTDSKCW